MYNNEKAKKIISVMLTVFMLFGVSTFAASEVTLSEPVINIDTVSFTANSGQDGVREIAVQAFLESDNSKIAHLAQLVTDSSGNVSYSFKIPATSPTGKYILRAEARGSIKAEKTFGFIHIADQKKFLDAIAEGESKIELVAGEFNEFMFPGTTKADISCIAMILFENKTEFTYTGETILDVYKKAVEKGNKAVKVIKDLNNASYAKLEEVFETNKEFLFGKSGLYEKYNALSIERKNYFAANYLINFTKTVATYSDFRTKFEENYNAYNGTVIVPVPPVGTTGGGGGGSSGGTRMEVSGTGSPANTVSGADSLFNDLESTEWAKDSIYTLYQKGVIANAADGKFRPQDYVTREEFVKMLVTALNFLNGEEKASFLDVSADSWYASYVDIAYSNGIVSGYEDNTFGSGKFITREELAAMAYRALLKAGVTPAKGNPEAFADASDIDGYANEAVYALKSANIINGSGNNMFLPKNNTTRAEAAKITAGLLKAFLNAGGDVQ